MHKRNSEEVKQAILYVYSINKSMAQTARRVSLRFGFPISEAFVSKILYRENAVIKKKNYKPASIYRYQLEN